MADKALISELTWRSLEMQKAAYPDMPHFVAPVEIPTLLRPSTRSDALHIYALSLAVIADNEKDFREFIYSAKGRKAILRIADMDKIIPCCRTLNMEWAVKAWRKARKNGAAKIGARISADKKESATKSAIELIREDWPKTSSEFSTEQLKERSGLSLNTIKKHLGSRPIAQYNYQAKLKRRAIREARA